jgi:hypothetical protein
VGWGLGGTESFSPPPRLLFIWWGTKEGNFAGPFSSEANLGKKRAEGAGRPNQKIEVFDNKTNLTTIYESSNEAARALNIRPSRISMYFRNNQLKPFKGRYIFKILK